MTDIDQPLPEDDAIKAAHPTRSGRHDLYEEAMRLVGAKHSKAALVELVNWLLVERDEARELVRCVEIGLCSMGVSPGLQEEVIGAVRRWRAEAKGTR